MKQRIDDLLPAPVEPNNGNHTVYQDLGIVGTVRFYQNDFDKGIISYHDDFQMNFGGGESGNRVINFKDPIYGPSELDGQWALNGNVNFANTDTRAVIWKGYLADYVNTAFTNKAPYYILAPQISVNTATPSISFPRSDGQTSTVALGPLRDVFRDNFIATYNTTYYNGYVAPVKDVVTQINYPAGTPSTGIAIPTGYFFRPQDRIIIVSTSTKERKYGYCVNYNGGTNGNGEMQVTFDTNFTNFFGPFVISIDPQYVAVAGSGTPGLVKISAPVSATNGSQNQDVITNATATLRFNAFLAAASTWTGLQTFNGGFKTPVVSASLKMSVINGTYADGELSGTQPAGSISGMKFRNGTYQYWYSESRTDTDGTQFSWVRMLIST